MKQIKNGFTPFETHMHTREVSPCGQVDAATMMAAYAEKGYGGVFVTDHLSPYSLAHFASDTKDYFHLTLTWPQIVTRYLRGYDTAKLVGEPMGLKVFLGVELTLEQGPEDYLILGIDREFLLAHPHIQTYSLPALKTAVHNYGLFLYQAHPFRQNLTLQHPDHVDGLEVYNGNGGEERNRNSEVLEEAERRHCLMTSGSDAHATNNVGRGGLWLPADINNGYDMAQYIATHNAQLERIQTI